MADLFENDNQLSPIESFAMTIAVRLSEMAPLQCSVAQTCGGCPLIGHSGEAAKSAKLATLREALEHTLGESFATLPIRWVTRGSDSGYRCRVRLKVNRDGRIAFFNRDKSYDCAVLLPSLRTAVLEFMAFANNDPIPFEEIEHLELRSPDLDGKIGLFLTMREASPHISDCLRARLAQLPKSWLWGSADPLLNVPQQRVALANLYHFVPLNSFLQVNRRMNDCLIEDLRYRANALSIKSFCDLYSGAGNFSLPLLASGAEGLSVEYDGAAIAACQDAATAQGFHRGEFRQGDAAAVAQHLLTAGRRFDLVILDPPRAGAKNAIGVMGQLSRCALVYFSCNPLTLATDLLQLQALGFAIESVTAYDMFEATRHLETCVWLRAPCAPSRRV